MSDDSVTIQPGDELRADRGPYKHVGFYIGNDMVVQFGGRIKDKPRASIHCVPYAEFAKCDRVELVQHDNLDRTGAVNRALWLLHNPPPMSYHLFATTANTWRVGAPRAGSKAGRREKRSP
jgi:hypothetical protein